MQRFIQRATERTLHLHHRTPTRLGTCYAGPQGEGTAFISQERALLRPTRLLLSFTPPCLHPPSPWRAAGHLYHIKWVQDETGQLKLHDYHRDPVSNVVLSVEGGGGDADGASIVATAGGSQASLASGAAVVTIVAEH